MKKLILFALVCLMPLAAMAGDMDDRLTPDAAFATIPKERNAFDFSRSQLPMAEQEYLRQLFDVVDDAVAERVSAMQAISAGHGYNPKYRDIQHRLSSLEVPEKFREPHRLIASAIDEQYQYLEDWRLAHGAFDPNAGLVKSSSSKLIQAYGILTGADSANRAVYYNHLCALDFI